MCYCTWRLQKSGISHHIILPPRTEILGRLHTSVKVTILRIPVTHTQQTTHLTRENPTPCHQTDGRTYILMHFASQPCKKFEKRLEKVSDMSACRSGISLIYHPSSVSQHAHLKSGNRKDVTCYPMSFNPSGSDSDAKAFTHWSHKCGKFLKENVE